MTINEYLILYSTLVERRVAHQPFNSRIGAERGQQLFFVSVRGLAQRRLAFHSTTSYCANENIAGAGDRFFREAVSVHHPVFLSRRLSPSLLCPTAPKELSDPSVLTKSWNRRPSGATKLRRNSSAGMPSVQGGVGAQSPPSRRSRVAHLKSCFTRLICFDKLRPYRNTADIPQPHTFDLSEKRMTLSARS